MVECDLAKVDAAGSSPVYCSERVLAHASSGAVAQLVRVPPCHGGSRGFKSRRSRKATVWLSSYTDVIVFQDRRYIACPYGPVGEFGRPRLPVTEEYRGFKSRQGRFAVTNCDRHGREWRCLSLVAQFGRAPPIRGRRSQVQILSGLQVLHLTRLAQCQCTAPGFVSSATVSTVDGIRRAEL